MRPLDRDYDPALTWAGDLSRRLGELDRVQIEAIWNSPEGRGHREELKRLLPDALRQLVKNVTWRLSELPKEQAA